MPDLDLRGITDKSSGDLFTKGLAVLQVSWLMVSLLIRAVRHLAVSQLEILTITFAACSLFIYELCWDKPQDINTPMRLITNSQWLLEPGVVEQLRAIQPESIRDSLLHLYKNRKFDM
jgi:hypothetical protein